MNRKAIFVMGHPEGQAATITLNADYYKNSQRYQKRRKEYSEMLC
jgi:hypothetical protein